MLSTAFAYAEPMIANCSSHSGLQSTFAPESSRTVGPLSAGHTVAIAGREIPSIVRSLINAIAKKCAAVAGRNDRIGLALLNEIDRDSERRSLAGAGGASTARGPSRPPRGRAPADSFGLRARAEAGERGASSPTNRISALNSCAASSAPATISCGAWSPPIASIAMRARFMAARLLEATAESLPFVNFSGLPDASGSMILSAGYGEAVRDLRQGTESRQQRQSRDE